MPYDLNTLPYAGWGAADGGGDRKASMLNTLPYALVRCRMQVGDLRMEAEIAKRVCNDVKSTNAALVRERLDRALIEP